MEGAHYLATGKLVSLSEQQLVDCDHQCDPEELDACDSACNGGLMTNAYKYVEEAGGLELESNYPYTSRDGKCGFNSNNVAAKVANFTNIPVDEDQVAAYLIKSGPLATLRAMQEIAAQTTTFPLTAFISLPEDEEWSQSPPFEQFEQFSACTVSMAKPL